MLPAQVSYWTLQENKRHNLVTEDLGFKNLNETIRHNTVSETETHRHNVETEKLGWFNADESRRHNLATEQVAIENVGLGYANLSESVRHNRASEAIQSTQAYASVMQGQAAMENAGTNYLRAQHDFLYQQETLHQGWANIQNQQRLADINQQNADTNERNAEINQQNADTHTREANIREEEKQIKQQQADTQQYSAETDRYWKTYRSVLDTWNSLRPHKGSTETTIYDEDNDTRTVYNDEQPGSQSEGWIQKFWHTIYGGK